MNEFYTRNVLEAALLAAGKPLTVAEMGQLFDDARTLVRAAAERTKHIKLGTGVTSLPYHHPFMVAQRFVQLDHMTRGRAMMGCGPGALTSDAYMLGIEPSTQRPRMLEAMDAIMRLLKCEEPVTMKTDWFEMRDARLHLAPQSRHWMQVPGERHAEKTYFHYLELRPKRFITLLRHPRYLGFSIGNFRADVS